MSYLAFVNLKTAVITVIHLRTSIQKLQRTSIIIFIFCLLQHVAAAADVSQSRHNRSIVPRPMYSLPTEHHSADRLAANAERQQQSESDHCERRQSQRFIHSHWSGVFSAVVFCVRLRGLVLVFAYAKIWPNVASMNPTSGPFNASYHPHIHSLRVYDAALRHWKDLIGSSESEFMSKCDNIQYATVHTQSETIHTHALLLLSFVKYVFVVLPEQRGIRP